MKSKKKLILCLIYTVITSFLFSQIVITDSNMAVQIALYNSKSNIYEELNSLATIKKSSFSVKDFLPSLTFSYSGSKNVSYFSSDTDSKSLIFSVSQILFDGGKRKFTYDINNINSLYMYNEVEQSLREFSSEILNQYYAILKQKEIVNIKNDLVNTVTDQLHIIEKEKELGITLETDYLEYLITYLDTVEDRDKNVRNLEKMINSFKMILGYDKNIDIEFIEKFSNDKEYQTINKYFDFLYKRAVLNSLELKKKNLEILSNKKQIDYNNKWYLPSISLEASVSFSGTYFPLTEPDYSIQLVFSFDKFPLLPTTYKKNIGIQNEINSIGDNIQTTILPSTTFPIEKRLSEISLLQNQINYSSSKDQLYESLLEIVYNHDDYVHDSIIKEKTIELLEQKLKVMSIDLKNGNTTENEYLKSLIELSSTKIELLESKVNIGIIENSIEIMINIPFGELLNVCEKQK